MATILEHAKKTFEAEERRKKLRKKSDLGGEKF